MRQLSTILLLMVGLIVNLQAQISVENLASYTPGDNSMIIDYDVATQRLFNTGESTLTIIDMSDPANPSNFKVIDVTPYGQDVEPNGLAVSNGIVALALGEDPDDFLRGTIVFFDTDGNFLNQVIVGYLPDMVTFTPDGSKLLVANEGEPNDDYTQDPEGTVSIVDLSGGVASATVTEVGLATAPLEGPVRIFGPGASQGQDLEPEFITISPDQSTAYVACQENNALAIIDIASATCTKIVGLGYKDYSLDRNALDASDRDGGINRRTFDNVFGMYQPDGMTIYTVGGKDFIITANEGDARDYDGFSEEDRVDDLPLDPAAFPNASELQKDENLGRKNATITLGDANNDGLYEEIYTYGTRSFSIWDAETLELVYDSGNLLERITEDRTPAYYNANDGDPGEFDRRSDNKGPEPEAVIVAMVGGKPHAFVGLERSAGGAVVFDVSNPYAPNFVDYIVNPGVDIALEDLVYVSESDSPTGQALLFTANEESATIGVYGITVVEPVPTMGEWGLFLFALVIMTLGAVFVYNSRKELAV